jgi:glycosyltransferase involved in cell wall biosynthesis
MGETSGSVIRALSLSKPLVVSDVGWFAELPDEVALKIAPDEHEVEHLLAALQLLVRDEATRTAMGAAALALARGEHALDFVAERYTAALEEAAGGEVVRTAVLEDVAQAAADVGATDTAELAERLDEVGLGR